MRHEHGIDIACHASGIVCQGHGSTTDDEYVGNDIPADKPLAQGGEGAFKFSPSQEDIVALVHAASKSLADR
jgi:hypothetical protein